MEFSASLEISKPAEISEEISYGLEISGLPEISLEISASLHKAGRNFYQAFSPALIACLCSLIGSTTFSVKL